MKAQLIDPILETSDLLEHRTEKFQKLLSDKYSDDYEKDKNVVPLPEIMSYCRPRVKKALKYLLGLFVSTTVAGIISIATSIAFQSQNGLVIGVALTAVSIFFILCVANTEDNITKKHWESYIFVNKFLIGKLGRKYIETVSTKIPDLSQIETSQEVRKIGIVVEYNKRKSIEQIDSTITRLRKRQTAIRDLPVIQDKEEYLGSYITKIDNQISLLESKRLEVNDTYLEIEKELNSFGNHVRSKEAIIELKLADDDIEASNELMRSIDEKLKTTAQNIKALGGAVRELSDLSAVDIKALEEINVGTN